MTAVEAPLSNNQTDEIAGQFIALAGLELDAETNLKLQLQLSAFLFEYTKAVVMQTVTRIAQQPHAHSDRQ